MGLIDRLAELIGRRQQIPTPEQTPTQRQTLSPEELLGTEKFNFNASRLLVLRTRFPEIPFDAIYIADKWFYLEEGARDDEGRHVSEAREGLQFNHIWPVMPRGEGLNISGIIDRLQVGVDRRTLHPGLLEKLAFADLTKEKPLDDPNVRGRKRTSWGWIGTVSNEHQTRIFVVTNFERKPRI